MVRVKKDPNGWGIDLFFPAQSLAVDPVNGGDMRVEVSIDQYDAVRLAMELLPLAVEDGDKLAKAAQDRIEQAAADWDRAKRKGYQAELDEMHAALLTIESGGVHNAELLRFAINQLEAFRNKLARP